LGNEYWFALQSSFDQEEKNASTITLADDWFDTKSLVTVTIASVPCLNAKNQICFSNATISEEEGKRAICCPERGLPSMSDHPHQGHVGIVNILEILANLME
jgi:hypothetical protein